jgi:hypothetical protein
VAYVAQQMSFTVYGQLKKTNSTYKVKQIFSIYYSVGRDSSIDHVESCEVILTDFSDSEGYDYL